jgi:hypothetical protein
MHIRNWSGAPPNADEHQKKKATASVAFRMMLLLSGACWNLLDSILAG